MSNCRVMCEDGEILEVDLETALMSIYIKELIEEMGTEEITPVPHVCRPVMVKVIEFCERMKEHTPPEIDKPLQIKDLTPIAD